MVQPETDCLSSTSEDSPPPESESSSASKTGPAAEIDSKSTLHEMGDASSTIEDDSISSLGCEGVSSTENESKMRLKGKARMTDNPEVQPDLSTLSTSSSSLFEFDFEPSRLQGSTPRFDCEGEYDSVVEIEPYYEDEPAGTTEPFADRNPWDPVVFAEMNSSTVAESSKLSRQRISLNDRCIGRSGSNAMNLMETPSASSSEIRYSASVTPSYVTFDYLVSEGGPLLVGGSSRHDEIVKIRVNSPLESFIPQQMVVGPDAPPNHEAIEQPRRRELRAQRCLKRLARCILCSYCSSSSWRSRARAA